MVQLDKCEKQLKTQRREQRAQTNKSRELNEKLKSIEREAEVLKTSVHYGTYLEIKKIIND